MSRDFEFSVYTNSDAVMEVNIEGVIRFFKNVSVTTDSGPFGRIEISWISNYQGIIYRHNIRNICLFNDLNEYYSGSTPQV